MSFVDIKYLVNGPDIECHADLKYGEKLRLISESSVQVGTDHQEDVVIELANGDKIV